MSKSFKEFKREVDAIYHVRTGMTKFEDGGGDDGDLKKYHQDGVTPYEAVSNEIDRYNMDDLGHNERQDYETARHNRYL